MKMIDMKCIFCHRGMKEVGALSRINETGVPGIWACREHRNLSDKKFDPETDRIVDLIQQRKPAP